MAAGLGSDGIGCGVSRCGEREFGPILGDIRGPAMRAAGLTGLGAVAKRLVNDRLDGARAAAAFGAATEAAIDLLDVAQRVVSGADGMADIVVAEDVAGADDHELQKTFGDATSSIWEDAA